MHLLTIVFGPSPTPWAFMFQKLELAEKAFNDLQMVTPTVKIADEFGQCAVINTSQIHGVMLEDLEKSKLAYIERELHQARTIARTRQIAAGDPILKAAAMAQGPAILSPMGNGRFPS